VTVLFADIKGSTELIEGLDPEQSLKRLEPTLTTMIDAVHRYEGTVNRVQGDGIMALFGAPVAHEDHAIRACYAALAMQEAINRQGQAFETQARVGLHSGRVLVRSIGNDLSMDYDAIGPTVHLASRMEQLAIAGTIRLSAETCRLAEGFIEVKTLGPTPIKGLTQPVETCELLGASTVRTRFQAASSRGLTRFVGRDSELQILRKACERARRSQGQIVAVVGEPGVGKSRLFHEFAHSESTHGWLALHGSSVSYGKASAWLPVIELLKSYCHIEARDGAPQIREKVTDKVLGLDKSLQSLLPPLVSLFDLPVEDTAWNVLDPPQRRRRTIDAVKALLLRESDEQPVLVVFEDLHWADPDSLALVDSLIDSLPIRRILLLVNYRPEFTHQWGSRDCYSQMRLDPLAAPRAEELLDVLLGPDPALAGLRKQLTQAAKGNPLFVEESVRSLADSGALTGRPGTYHLSGEVKGIEVPATVQAIIASRIDRLPAATKELLQSAAAIGYEFPFAVLRTVSHLPEDQIREGLSELRGADFIYEMRLFPDFEYTFKHAFTHEVAYGDLVHEQRRQLHGSIGEAIESLYPDRQKALAETLADHFEEGEHWEKAASYCLRAAEKAKDRFAYARGAELCRKSLACLAHVPGLEDEQRSGLVMLGDLLSLTGEADAANESYDLALEVTRDGSERRAITNKRHRLGFATRDGARIAHYEHGSGDDVLILVHPIAYDTAVFQPLVETLCQEFRIVQIFGRGNGLSDPVPWPYRMAQRVEDIRVVVERLGHHRKVGIGLSQGGRLLVRLTYLYPALLDRLILVGTGLGDRAIGSPFETVGGSYATEMEAIQRNEIEAVAARGVREALSEPGTEDLADAYISKLSRLGRDVWLNFFDTGPEGEIVPLLSGVRVPTLIIHGSEDRYIPVEHGRYIASCIPSAQLRVFEGKGHLPILTATSEFCDVVREFVYTGSLKQ
jgi:class 3 adenylate cyclase/pimeloyl-ACP methyl ester carboxylesterase